VERSEGQRPIFLFALSLFPFILLCTANSAGYRYGAADLAFYVPAALERIDPALFPHDGALIASQARLTVIDEVIATLSRVTTLSLPALVAVLYCVTLTLLAVAVWLIGSRVYRTQWATLGLVAALTLRHAIAKSGTNSLEGYFHPRQLAFALGALAIAALLRGRLAVVAALVLAAGVIHPTTALWFAVWMAVAAAVNDRRLRVPLAAAASLAAVAGAWLVTAGPLAGRLVVMDPEWLATLATKDYLFPFEWPLYAWLINLLYAPLIVFVYRRRRQAGLVIPGEAGLVIGCLSLLLVFVVALPLNAARIALVVQLQTPRIFWMLDLMATLYVVWALADAAGTVRRAQVTALVIAAISVIRALYIETVRFPDRPIAQIDVADDDWGRAMAWARATPRETSWVADPMHAVKYGTSLRVAGERDVFVEAIKDAAIGMYTRDVAIRTRDRLAELAAFDAMTAARARSLGERYGLDYLVTEQPLDLPLAFASGHLRVYRLR
jgi:hypothetical protein